MRVFVTQEEREKIEEQTRDQDSSDQWQQERRKRLTASVVGGIAKMKEKQKSKKVQALLYSTFRGNQATRYGTSMEAISIDRYKLYYQKKYPEFRVDKCGLFISETNNWLAATPDGIVNDPSNTAQPLGLLEIKNPFSFKDQPLDEACKNSAFFLEVDKDTQQRRLKRRHDYYFQVQCQLYCTDKMWCDFVVCTRKDMYVERIHRDRKWWGTQLAKLRKFYFTALLPELALPRRHPRAIEHPTCKS